MYKAIAINGKTADFAILGYYEDEAEAWYDIHNNIQWEEEDTPEDWFFEVVEISEDEIPEEDYELDYDECGFDPYMGGYTYDC